MCRAICWTTASAIWNDLLDHCGFEIVRRKHFSLRDNPAGLASSLAPGLDPMARRVRKVRGIRDWKACERPALLRAGGGRAAIHAARSCLRSRVDHHGGGAQESLSYRTIERRLPRISAALLAAFRIRDRGALSRISRPASLPARACWTQARARCQHAQLLPGPAIRRGGSRGGRCRPGITASWTPSRT